MDDIDTISVGPVSGFSNGEKKVVCVRNQSILICNSNGKIFAVSNQCSHAFQALDNGRIANGWITCPAHGSRFDLENGRPLNPPATEAIATFPVKIVDGLIEIDVSDIA